MRAPIYSDRPEEIFDPSTFEDPFPLFARLRRSHPVARIAETGVHLVATRALVQEALERADDFSARLTGVLLRGDDGQPTTLALPPNPASRVIATADDPEHAGHRATIQPRFTPSRVAALETSIRSWAGDAIGRWLSDGGGDFVPVAEFIPARVVAELLGLPAEDVHRHRTWAMMGGDILAGAIDVERMACLAEESARMSVYLRTHLGHALASPCQGPEAPLLHALARAVRDGRLGEDEAVGIAAVLFGAGGESTAALLGSAVRRLAEAPALADTLRRAPDRIPAFVEEVIRLETPFKFHYRVVQRRCSLGGCALEPGNRLMLLWASANRDASSFEDPDTLRLDRRHGRDHVAFGRGAHFCIGAGLARLETRIACEELLARTRSFALPAVEGPIHARSIFVRRLDRLPLDAEERSRRPH